HAHLTARLPEYMAPAAYVRVKRIPLTKDGRVDRGSLPSPEDQACTVRGYEAPQGEIEAAVAAIWADVLKVQRVSRHDNFFELGGRSLLAVQVTARLLQSLRVEVGPRDLFAHPALNEFAQAVEGARQSRLPFIMRAERTEALPLSFAQQRLWFLAQM